MKYFYLISIAFPQESNVANYTKRLYARARCQRTVSYISPSAQARCVTSPDIFWHSLLGACLCRTYFLTTKLDMLLKPVYCLINVASMIH